jgi:hypothetical protein
MFIAKAPEQPGGVPNLLSSGAASASSAFGSTDLTLTPKPIEIVPTPYPNDPEAPLVVYGALTINVRSPAFRDFSASLDAVLHELPRSNEIAGEARDQVVAELEAGRRLLTAPKPDRSREHQNRCADYSQSGNSDRSRLNRLARA